MTTKELNELQAIVSALYGPNPNQTIVSFCESQKQYYLSNISQFHYLFSSLESSNNSYFNFWILDVLNNLIITQYSHAFTDEHKALFRKCIEVILSKGIPSIISVPFTSNKLSLLVINWLTYDYPENYPLFWNDYIKNIFNTTNQDEKIQKIAMLVDLLHTLDEELIKFRNSNSNFQAERAVKIKDHMRVNAINDIITVIGQVLCNEAFIEQKIISKSIRVVSELIGWNLLEYFDTIIQVVNNSLLMKIKYQGDCIEVLNAIVKKGMEPNVRIEVLTKMNINSVIDSIIKEKGTTGQSFELLSEVISNIGLFLTEVFEFRKRKMLDGNNLNDINNNINGNVIDTEAYVNYGIKQLSYCLYFTIQILTHTKFEYKTGMEFIDFLSAIISYLKSNPELIQSNQDLVFSIKTLHRTIENALMIPSQYKIATENLALLEEDDFFVFRKEYTLIYRNCFAFPFLQECILDNIISKASKLSQSSSLYEIEHCLFLIGAIINAVHGNYLKSNNTLAIKFNDIISLLFNIPFTQTVSDFILISYYDVICQSIQYILPNKPAMEFVIKLFLSKKGICVDSLQTGIKIISYFDKFLHKTESQIGKLPTVTLTDISSAIKQTLQSIINTGNFPLISEYQLLFHCLSIIISIDNNSVTRNKNYEEALKTFIEIFTKYQISNEMFCEVVKCLTHFLKNINAEIKDNELKTLFVNFFNVFIGEYCTQVLPQKQTKTLYGIVIILQRIIIILGNDSEQYLSFFFNKNNNFITSDIYEDSVKILQNMINITKQNSIGFISKRFAEFYLFIKKVQLPKEDISDVSKVANSMYSNYMKLVNTIIFEIPEVLFNNNGIVNLSLNEFISFMLYVAKDIIDSNTRRNILRSLKLLCAYLNDKYRKQIKIKEGTEANSYSNANSNVNDAYFNEKLIEEIMIIILNGLFAIYPKLKLTEPYDSSSMCEICQIHFYFSFFASSYSLYLLTVLSKEQAEAFYHMIIKVNPKQIKVSNDITEVFNVYYIYLMIYNYSILFKSRATTINDYTV